MHEEADGDLKALASIKPALLAAADRCVGVELRHALREVATAFSEDASESVMESLPNLLPQELRHIWGSLCWHDGHFTLRAHVVEEETTNSTPRLANHHRDQRTPPRGLLAMASKERSFVTDKPPAFLHVTDFVAGKPPPTEAELAAREARREARAAEAFVEAANVRRARQHAQVLTLITSRLQMPAPLARERIPLGTPISTADEVPCSDSAYLTLMWAGRTDIPDAPDDKATMAGSGAVLWLSRVGATEVDSACSLVEAALARADHPPVQLARHLELLHEWHAHASSSVRDEAESKRCVALRASVERAIARAEAALARRSVTAAPTMAFSAHSLPAMTEGSSAPLGTPKTEERGVKQSHSALNETSDVLLHQRVEFAMTQARAIDEARLAASRPPPVRGRQTRRGTRTCQRNQISSGGSAHSSGLLTPQMASTSGMPGGPGKSAGSAGNIISEHGAALSDVSARSRNDENAPMAGQRAHARNLRTSADVEVAGGEIAISAAFGDGEPRGAEDLMMASRRGSGFVSRGSVGVRASNATDGGVARDENEAGRFADDGSASDSGHSASSMSAPEELAEPDEAMGSSVAGLGASALFGGRLGRQARARRLVRDEAERQRLATLERKFDKLRRVPAISLQLGEWWKTTQGHMQMVQGLGDQAERLDVHTFEFIVGKARHAFEGLVVEAPLVYSRERGDEGFEEAMRYARRCAAENEASRKERLKRGDPLAERLPPEYLERLHLTMGMLRFGALVEGVKANTSAGSSSGVARGAASARLGGAASLRAARVTMALFPGASALSRERVGEYEQLAAQIAETLRRLLDKCTVLLKGKRLFKPESEMDDDFAASLRDQEEAAIRVQAVCRGKADRDRLGQSTESADNSTPVQLLGDRENARDEKKEKKLQRQPSGYNVRTVSKAEERSISASPDRLHGWETADGSDGEGNRSLPADRDGQVGGARAGRAARKEPRGTTAASKPGKVQRAPSSRELSRQSTSTVLDRPKAPQAAHAPPPRPAAVPACPGPQGDAKATMTSPSKPASDIHRPPALHGGEPKAAPRRKNGPRDPRKPLPEPLATPAFRAQVRLLEGMAGVLVGAESAKAEPGELLGGELWESEVTSMSFGHSIKAEGTPTGDPIRDRSRGIEQMLAHDETRLWFGRWLRRRPLHELMSHCEALDASQAIRMAYARELEEKRATASGGSRDPFPSDARPVSHNGRAVGRMPEPALRRLWSEAEKAERRRLRWLLGEPCDALGAALPSLDALLYLAEFAAKQSSSWRECGAPLDQQDPSWLLLEFATQRLWAAELKRAAEDVTEFARHVHVSDAIFQTL